MVDLSRVLDNNYDYPKRPCENGCMDGCIARADCPLYRTWEVRTALDKKLADANQAMRDAGFETVEETATREAVKLREAEKIRDAMRKLNDPDQMMDDTDYTVIEEAIEEITSKIRDKQTKAKAVCDVLGRMQNLTEFKKWWTHFEPQIDPELYNGDEDETRQAIARCTWRKCLEWMLKIVIAEHVRRIIKEELGVR